MILAENKGGLKWTPLKRFKEMCMYINMSIIEKVFHYNESKMNVVKCNYDIWFKGRDIANALGYENPLKAIRMHVDPDDKMPIDELLTVSKGVSNSDTPSKGGPKSF